MNFLEDVGFIAIVITLALIFERIFRNVKSRLAWRVLGIVFIIVLYFVISKGEDIYNSIFVPASTFKSTPVSSNTSRPLPLATATGKPCLRWSEIRTSMNGQTICVYGTIQAIYPTNETWTRIRFTDQPNSFFMFSQPYIFPDLSAGDCIQANGKVQLYESIPYIESDDLYYCESWMK